MSVTVVVPCHKRAEFLPVVLQSIKQQTFFSHIDNIIVSENSDDTSPRLVCDQFPELNITYYQQAVQKTAVEHLYWIINQSQSEITAMLHDDDWWYPTHLECGINALKDSSVSAYFSNFVFTKNEKMKGARFYHPSIKSYFVSDIANTGSERFTLSEIASICYLYTPFHMSTMVAKTESIKVANEKGLKTAKPWYADRIMYPFLTTCGDIVFNPQVLCGVREHEKNDGKTINQKDRFDSHHEASFKIQQLAQENNIDVIAQWRIKKDILNTSDWAEIVNIYNNYFGSVKEPGSVFEYKNMPVMGVGDKVKKRIKNVLVKLLLN